MIQCWLSLGMSAHTHAEMRSDPRSNALSSSTDDWKSVSNWANDFRLYSPNNMWMVQIPRIYPVFRARGSVQSYADVLRNVFEPLFAVSVDPSLDPNLAEFMRNLGGFDSVDDESRPERELTSLLLQEITSAAAWQSATDPPYALQMYYLWSNIQALNMVRKSRGLSMFGCLAVSFIGCTLIDSSSRCVCVCDTYRYQYQQTHSISDRIAVRAARPITWRQHSSLCMASTTASTCMCAHHSSTCTTCRKSV
jgi:hypothetical protein